MTTRKLFQNLAVSIFDIFDDITPTRTFRQYDASTYNLATGKAGQSYTDYSLKMLLSDIDERKDNFSDVLSSDRKVTIPAKLVSFTPKTGDVVLDDSVSYRVIEVRIDPADAVWVMQVRETNG